jgi:peptidoglycan/xylan/chitin deacetylase (PgdA/CDA1 family)
MYQRKKVALKRLHRKILLLITVSVIIGILTTGSAFAWQHFHNLSASQALTPADIAKQYQQVLPEVQPLDPTDASAAAKTATGSPTVTPSPQLSFDEMNSLYGPCTTLPTLMYHHVEDLEKAKAEGHAPLTVGTPYFRKQMEYLRDKHYSVLTMQDLLDFFDKGKALPKKPVLLTFDDGYDDFGSDAWPILKEFNFSGTMFLPTGLLENPGYLKWSTIKDIADQGKILMSNHTWSHHNMATSKTTIEKEILTARDQLVAHNLDSPQIFAYPYGTTSTYSATYLAQKGYQLAFTTQHGSVLCKKQRLILPRIRIGNAQLNNYGL